MRPHLLLTYDFPPMGGGIARMMGEVARRYPASLEVIETRLRPGGVLILDVREWEATAQRKRREPLR